MNNPIVQLTAAARSLQGIEHRGSGQPCQDRHFLIREETHCTAVLCDGCSTAAFGQEAAQITSQTVCNLLHQHFNYCLYADPLMIRQQFADAVEAALRKKAARCGADPYQLACTIVATSLDQRGRLVCLHLGDGGILRADTEGTLLRVSVPENGLLPGQTYLTMNCVLYRRLRLYRRDQEDTQSVLLYTDGVQNMLPQDPQLCDLTQSGDHAKLLRWLERHVYTDDASIALIQRIRPA